MVKSIVGFLKYAVSDSGNVYGPKGLLKPIAMPNGYYQD